LQRSLLLINYSFPPYVGVGGRRWAKLAKYLAKDNVKVYVIHAQNLDSMESSWTEDVVHENIIRYAIPNRREKIRNKIGAKVSHINSQLITSANYADQSLGWNKKAYQKAVDLIQAHQIKHVIVSCPPYHILHDFLKLKEVFPSIKYIVDYRDMWIAMQDGKGFFSHLSSSRFAKEKKMEQLVLSKADIITTVTDSMTDVYSQISGNPNCYTITNGFDTDDFKADLNLSFVNQYIQEGKINILFAGSLVNDSNVYAKPFFDAIAQLKKSFPDKYSRLHIQVIGQLNETIKGFIQSNELDIVKVSPSLPSSQLCGLLKHFDYLLLFLIPYYRFAFISKFFDYVYSKRPILAITEQGVFSDYLVKHKLGKWVVPENSLSALLEVTNEKSSTNETFDTGQFDYKFLAQQYSNIIFSA
jgi:glycosyltransferase involved in cell wall biosynthesis